MARHLIQNAATGESRIVGTSALPFFPGFVVLDTLDDGLPPFQYPTIGEADLRYVNLAEVDDPQSPTSVALRNALKGTVVDADFAGAIGNTASATVAALRAAFARRGTARLAGIESAVFPVPTMAAPPTITPGTTGVVHTTTGTTGSTLGAPVNYAYNTTGKWRFLGGTPGASGNYYGNGMLRGAALAGTRFMPPFQIEFMHRGRVLEFALRHVSTAGSWRVMVDGQWAHAAQSPAAADGARYLHKIDFGTRGTRRITLNLNLNYFGGVNIESTDSIWQAPAPDSKVLVIGDSYVAGSGGLGATTAWAVTMAEACGFTDMWQAGEASTGYVAVGTTPGAQTFQQRIESLIPQMAGGPDIVVILGGINDNPTNPTGAVSNAAAEAAALACYQKVRQLAPLCDLFVVGVQNVNNTESSQTQSIRNAAAAAGAGVVTAFFDTRPVGDPWITGTGRVGATTGDGNADINIAADGLHPWQEGHDYYGARVAKGIRDFYFSLARAS